MALKLDMSKPYDKVEWSGLKQIMLKMGFFVKWVNTIMQCLASVTYSIRINGFHMGISPLLGGYTKVTRYLPICFYCV